MLLVGKVLKVCSYTVLGEDRVVVSFVKNVVKIKIGRKVNKNYVV